MAKRIGNVRGKKDKRVTIDPNGEGLNADSRALPAVEATTEKTPSEQLREGKYYELYNRIWDWYVQERMIQAENRFEMALDEDYYDGIQWSPEDRAVVEERGQAALVFNEIKPSIDWIIGTQRRTRMDWKVHPRGKEDLPSAENKTKLLKYTSDVNRSPSVRALAFDDAVKAGLGWMECGIRGDITEEPLFDQFESWRRVWYDHLSIQPDYSDARFLFRDKWVDMDIAVEMFPEHAEALRSAATENQLALVDHDEMDIQTALYYNTDALGYHLSTAAMPFDVSSTTASRRTRMKLVECWYKRPERMKLLNIRDKSPDLAKFHGMPADPESSFQKLLIDGRYASLVDAMQMRMHQAIFVEGQLLQCGPMPYRHNTWTLTPIWCYRRKRDNAPYGMIRNLRDPQDDLNKRKSKALHILSSRQVIADDDAVKDWDNLREEVADPMGIIKKKRGTELTIQTDVRVGEEHVKLSLQDQEFIRSVSGVTAESRGLQTNADSGKAIIARQEQGSVVTYQPFENLLSAMEMHGQKQLSLCEQYYDFQKVVRLIGEKGEAEFTTINDPSLPESDITRTQADFIVATQDFRDTVRIAMFEQLTNIVMKQPPEIVIQLLDLMFEMSDMPGADEAVKRIRKINGHRDPNEQLSPEEEAALQQEAQYQQFMKELEQAMGKAQVDELVAKVRKLNADADKVDSDKVTSRLTGYNTATDAVIKLAPAPALAGAVDTLINNASGPAAGLSPMPDAAEIPQVKPPQPEGSAPSQMH